MGSQELDTTEQLSTILFVAIVYSLIGHRAHKNKPTSPQEHQPMYITKAPSRPENKSVGLNVYFAFHLCL